MFCDRYEFVKNKITFITGLNEGNPGGGIENGGNIGGKPIGGGIAAIFGGSPGTGGMATAVGKAGGIPPNIEGGNSGAVEIRPGDPALGGS